LKHNYFLNSITFRVAAPALFGIIIYLLVLMFFDSIQMLQENFFSREVLFIILVTYVFFEGNRLVLVLNNKLFPVEKDLKTRIIAQYLISIFLSVCIISLLLYYYFVNIEGFSTIRTELITFNSIYLFICVFYNLFFFSLVFLNKKNESKVEFELKRKEGLDIELRTFKNQVNPELLFQSLEIIISELHQDKKSADDLIDQLSKIYRFTLDNKNNDLIPLHVELKSLKPFISVFKAKYDQNLQVELNVDKEKMDLNLIPGTLQEIMEFALSNNIISEALPLTFQVESKNINQLEVRYPLHKKLSDNRILEDKLEFLFNAYGYYNNSHDKHNYSMIDNDYQVFLIPLVEIEED